MMDQCRVTNELVNWMRSFPWKPKNNVRYDGRSMNPHTPDAETCALYIGPKLKGKGRTAQIAQVDILVDDEETKTVDLLIEVEPENSPKKILGEVLPALLADHYTPSNLYGTPHQRQIRDAVFLFVTVVPDKDGSQKRLQLEQLEQSIIEKLDFHTLNVRTIRFCVGSSESDAIHRCKTAIRQLLHTAGSVCEDQSDSLSCGR